MYSKKDFNVGDQISFIYNGGSRPGAVRLVDVNVVGDKYIKGLDHYSKDERCFSYDKMGGLTYIFRTKPPIKLDITLAKHDMVEFVVSFYDDTSIVFYCNMRDNTLKINSQEIKTLNDLEFVISQV